jgi:hypothetical protein
MHVAFTHANRFCALPAPPFTAVANTLDVGQLLHRALRAHTHAHEVNIRSAPIGGNNTSKRHMQTASSRALANMYSHVQGVVAEVRMLNRESKDSWHCVHVLPSPVMQKVASVWENHNKMAGPLERRSSGHLRDATHQEHTSLAQVRI